MQTPRRVDVESRESRYGLVLGPNGASGDRCRARAKNNPEMTAATGLRKASKISNFSSARAGNGWRESVGTARGGGGELSSIRNCWYTIMPG